MDMEAITQARKKTHRMVPGGKRRPLRPTIRTSMTMAKSGHIRSPAPRTHQSRYAQ